MSKRPLLIFCDTLVNLGDLALLAQSVAAGRNQGRQVYVRQWAPPPPIIARQVEALGASIVSGRAPAALLRLASRCDAVIGGGQIVRSNVSLASLIAMIWALTLVRLGGGRVSGWGMGVGPVRGWRTRFLWRLVFRPGERIAVRDPLSLDHARRLFPARAVVQSADMAFLAGALHHDLTAEESERTSVLIAPCIEGSEGRSIDGEGFPTLLACVRQQMPKAPLVLACHDPRPEVDGGAADWLIAYYDLNDARKLDDGQLATLCEAYREAVLTVTNRLHASIFTLLSGGALLVVDDGSDKMRALCRDFAIPSIRISGPPDADLIGRTVAAAVNFDRKARKKAMLRIARRAQSNLLALGDHAATQPVERQGRIATRSRPTFRQAP
ncbi:polysaccharide pyruvyl transferase family protein [Novosphingobium rosa]|uniref:polysaccharide pyruvyl transferase family protein n=1 Tax=Novosphingobium rosa TaxID=76978 RepID=UPI00082F2AFE|nr:polysaccharide pyruvyl transferase family protein [Novosphingobium rosa]